MKSARSPVRRSRPSSRRRRCASAAPSRSVKKPGRLEHHVDTRSPHGKLRRDRVRRASQRLAVAPDHAVGERRPRRRRAEVRVVAEQVRHRLRVPEVVDGDDLDVRAELSLRPEEVAADPAEPVDRRPVLPSLLSLGRRSGCAASLITTAGANPSYSRLVGPRSRAVDPDPICRQRRSAHEGQGIVLGASAPTHHFRPVTVRLRARRSGGAAGASRPWSRPGRRERPAREAEAPGAEAELRRLPQPVGEPLERPVGPKPASGLELLLGRAGRPDDDWRGRRWRAGWPGPRAPRRRPAPRASARHRLHRQRRDRLDRVPALRVRREVTRAVDDAEPRALGVERCVHERGASGDGDAELEMRRRGPDSEPPTENAPRR